METTIEQVDDVTVVILPGEHLDGSNSNQFKCHIVPVLGAHRKLLFDMSQLRFVDSSGLGAILSCLRQVNAAGGELKLCGMLKPVRSLFELVRMNRIVDIIDTKAEALQSFQHE